METIKVNERVEKNYGRFKKKLEKADIATIGHHTEFGFMAPKIRSMNPRIGKIFGQAFTVRTPAQDSKAVHLAVSLAKAGDIIVIDRSLDDIHACVGEMVALCAKERGLSGIVVDGPMTDIEEILKIGIPVFATGVSGMTTKFISSCGEINEDISCGGVVVHPGDLIMADSNGVMCLREFELERLLDIALKDQALESKDYEEVLAGKTLQQLYIPEYSAQ